MFKKSLKMFAILFASTMLLTSCYTYTTVVGEGAQGNKEISKWNHYVLYGLAPVAITDAKQMAGGTVNYTVTTKQTFVNGLVTGITFGIYAPTTTTVTK